MIGDNTATYEVLGMRLKSAIIGWSQLGILYSELEV